jgi:hypothetical protein
LRASISDTAELQLSATDLISISDLVYSSSRRIVGMNTHAFSPAVNFFQLKHPSDFNLKITKPSTAQFLGPAVKLSTVPGSHGMLF